jgi:hypothetical protein
LIGHVRVLLRQIFKCVRVIASVVRYHAVIVYK